MSDFTRADLNEWLSEEAASMPMHWDEIIPASLTEKYVAGSSSHGA
jgi:hypothetical protein